MVTIRNYLWWWLGDGLWSLYPHYDPQVVRKNVACRTLKSFVTSTKAHLLPWRAVHSYPLGKLRPLLKMAIYSWVFHWTWCFFIVYVSLPEGIFQPFLVGFPQFSVFLLLHQRCWHRAEIGNPDGQKWMLTKYMGEDAEGAKWSSGEWLWLLCYPPKRLTRKTQKWVVWTCRIWASKIRPFFLGEPQLLD